MIDETEWGPWVTHDGRGCPVVGRLLWIEIGDCDGLRPEDGGAWGGDWTPVGPRQAIGVERFGDAGWIWGWRDDEYQYFPITRYRLRRPRLAAMDILRDLVADPRGPVTAPAGPLRQPDEVPA